MNCNLHFSSKTDLWNTPKYIFDIFNYFYHFNTDVCATDYNHLCEHYYTKEIDGLQQEWYGNCWMNPPYGRDIYNWVKKAYLSSLNGTIVVCLLPARTDTKWFQEFIFPYASVIRFIKGRLKFGNSENSAPFPSVIVVFDHYNKYNKLNKQIIGQLIVL